MNSFDILSTLWITLILASSLSCKSIEQRTLPSADLLSYQHYNMGQLTSYGNCKAVNLTEIWDGKIVSMMMVCFKNPQEPQTSAAVGFYVNPENGFFGVLYKGDQMKDYMLEDNAFKLDMRFDNGETYHDYWFSETDWQWAYIQNDLEYFYDVMDRVASGNELGVRTPPDYVKDHEMRYDFINLNGSQAAINDYKGRIQGLRSAMLAIDGKMNAREEDFIIKITSQMAFINK